MEFVVLFVLLLVAYAARGGEAVNAVSDGHVPYYSLSLKSGDSLDRD